MTFFFALFYAKYIGFFIYAKIMPFRRAQKHRYPYVIVIACHTSAGWGEWVIHFPLLRWDVNSSAACPKNWLKSFTLGAQGLTSATRKLFLRATAVNDLKKHLGEITFYLLVFPFTKLNCIHNCAFVGWKKTWTHFWGSKHHTVTTYCHILVLLLTWSVELIRCRAICHVWLSGTFF